MEGNITVNIEPTTTDVPVLPKKNILSDERHDDAYMDKQRNMQKAYDYLCRIGEAKEWMEACLKHQISRTEELDEDLRNGINLAQLARLFQPQCVKKIFEDKTKLQFRHSDNINFFFAALKAEGLPDVFMFELTDLYEKKNIPKVIYCIHAYSYLLAKKGKAPNIKNLAGKLEFTDEALGNAALGLGDQDVPDFGNISKDLDKEMNQESDEDRLKRENLAAAKIQAHWKGSVQRKAYKETMNRFKSNAGLFVKIQARFRGNKQRKVFNALKQDYKLKEKYVVKIQAWWKGVNARRQYKDLLLKKGDVDVKVVQRFLHLLETHSNENDEERQVEELRGQVIQKIRENTNSEQELNELDAKVALLIKNRISLEEVAHLKSKDMRAALAKSAALADKDGGILSLKGNDKDTREKRKKYEELFYLLQTQPKYLASLLFIITKTSSGLSTKFLEQVVLTLFGYAQNSREEYLFLHLIEECIELEVKESAKASEALKDNPLFIKLVLQYTRGAKERDYLRGMLKPLLEAIMSDNSLDLETDALAIYKAVIREEELTTGEKSAKPYDVTHEVALEDEKVKAIYASNMLKLKELTDTFLNSIVKSHEKMPYGIRYVAMKIKEKLKAKFTSPECEKEINQVVGSLLYYRYINPVIISPEAFDVIESVVSPTQRKNLAEVAKNLNQVSVNRLVARDDEQSKYMAVWVSKFSMFLRESINVVSAEEYFGMDEFFDSGKQSKHTVYITPDEIVQVHHSLVENLQQLPTVNDDPLRTILNEMGIPPALGNAAKGPGSEVVLRLNDRFGKIAGSDENAEGKKLLKETKRYLLLVIRFSAGKNLLDILEQVPTAAQESAFSNFIQSQDLNKAQSGSQLNLASANSASILDINAENASVPIFKAEDATNLTLAQTKIKALENMAKLETLKLASKSDNYQSMLDSIVEDMLNKQRLRAKRHRELLSLRQTMINLREKSTYLEESTKSYHDYIDACLAQLTNKKGKTKKPVLFSRQYYHMQNLKKNGAVPKFGSFKYTAAELHKKGVLISIEDQDVKKLNMVTLTISSDEAGVFNMEVTFLGAKVSEKEVLRLEDLLQSQYNKIDVITLFDNAKVNLNLLIFLINKKFYA